MSDRRFALITAIAATILWATLQTTVYAAQPKPEPIRYTATVAVAVIADPFINTYTQEGEPK